MPQRIAIIDYGSGNLHSASKAFERAARESGIYAEILVTPDPDDVRAAERIVLPGVGAFGKAMNELDARGMKNAVLEFVTTGRPFLGICVGMQLLFQRSTEFGEHEGLGILSGEIEKFDTDGKGSPRLRLPNVNWLPIQPDPNADGLAAKLLRDVTHRSRFYFDHSYRAYSSNPHTTATSHYGGQSFAAAVGKGSVFATQFHPEKSGPDGLKMLKAFIS